MRNALSRWLPCLHWPRPTTASLRQDAFAGLTVGLMLVPQSIAYAALAGMPLETGLYASMLPLVVMVLLASSPLLGTGPTALTALMVASALAPMAQAASPAWVTLAVWLALLAGLFQVLLGLARLDWLLGVVTAPVLSGFTQAAALLIMASQVPALTGVSWDAWLTARSPAELGWLLQAMDGRALVFGLAGIAALVLTRRFASTIPSAALVMATGAAISWLTGYAASGSAVIGELHAHWQGLALPHGVGLGTLAQLVLPALVIALMSFVEVTPSARTEHALAGTSWNPNQDLLAQGLGKITAGLAGSFATSASFSRSAVNHYAGARTGWSALFAALLVLLATLWLTPLLRHVPLALLAALVVTAVSGLIKPRALARLWNFSRVEAGIAVLTLVVTLLAAPRIYWGVLAGLLANLAYFMYQRLHPRIIEVGRYPEDGRLRDRHLWHLPPLAEEVLALRLDAGLDFATASALTQRVEREWDARPQLRSICLVAGAITNIDATGLEALYHLRELAARRGGQLYLSGMKLPLETRLRQAGLLGDAAHVRVLQTDAQTVQALAQLQHPDGATEAR
ncbi:SulP family inorganic anion transporter [Corticibacter populi]|uniref:SulP family inorganic anion transporter n=1 Tax=Corticibacter populi TaxID=1550736 RepID=A0A3M6QJB3_9BURK|nr:SulP family inorganic anion transporter [Corticibacter populi]RMX03065.1 SulP family inorganic anion transporter [Corticibacter populi]RZS33506.1 SulP family sulfate permease [Corticibacter populi]